MWYCESRVVLTRKSQWLRGFDTQLGLYHVPDHTCFVHSNTNRKTTMKIIRCKQCRRHFMDDIDRCPECNCKAPRGRIMATVKIVSLAVTFSALALTFYILNQVK